MGGHALTFETRRVNRDEFDEISKFFIGYLNKSGIRAVQLGFIGDKQTFGDLDILIESESIAENCGFDDIHDYIKNRYNPSEIKKNGNVYSFDYKGFQIDFILMPKAHFECAKQYYNCEIGNFLGRIANSMGFWLGHEGLFYKMYLHGKTQLFGEIPITNDWAEIKEFLGIFHSSNQYHSLSDLYETICDSIYFKKEIFALENLNHINRTRNRKRPQYAGFVEYIEKQQPPEGAYSRGSKKDHLLQAFEVFPDFFEKYIDMRDKINESFIIKSKFNGDLVQLWTGLKEQKLGEFMQLMKSKPDWTQFVLDNEKRVVKKFVEDEFMFISSEENHVARN